MTIILLIWHLLTKLHFLVHLYASDKLWQRARLRLPLASSVPSLQIIKELHFPSPPWIYTCLVHLISPICITCSSLVPLYKDCVCHCDFAKSWFYQLSLPSVYSCLLWFSGTLISAWILVSVNLAACPDPCLYEVDDFGLPCY